MPDKRLGVELTAKETVSKALASVRKATEQTQSTLGKLPNIAKRVGSALGDMAHRGITALGSLAEKVFYLRALIQTLSDVVTRAFEAFVKPAITARKLQVSLTNLTGSAETAKSMLAQVQQVALDTGASFTEMSAALPDLVGRLTNAQGAFDPTQWADYLTALKRIIAFRPDLSATEQMALVNDMMSGNVEAAAQALGKSQSAIEDALGVGDKDEQQLGKYTSILRGADGVKASASQVVAALDQLGVVSENVDRTATALDRLRERWEKFKRAIGEKILDRVVDALIRLMDWLEANEPAVLALADTIANALVDAVIALLDWLTPERLDAITGSIGSMVGMVADLVSAFVSMPSWVQKLLVGGAIALGPLGGGKALAGLAGKGLGGLLGGGGATAAAGGGAAAAGGTALGGLATGAGLAAGGALLGLGATDLISRTKWGKSIGAQSARTTGSVLAYGAGSALGGKELGDKWFSKVSGIEPQKQQVEVKVSVEDSGALIAYTTGRISDNNQDMVAGWSGQGSGGGRLPSYGGWGSK